MGTVNRTVASPVVHKLRDIEPGNRKDVATLARLHMQLLDFGPMARLGELFVRKVCYGVHLQDGLMRAALYEVEGRPVGFVAYSPQSIAFHRTGLKKHWAYAAWVLTISLLRAPYRLFHVLRAVRVVLSRRAEHDLAQDPLGEVVAIGVLPAYLTPEFIRRTGVRIGEELVAHASAYFQRAGIGKMRMIVDADNKPALFFYHRLGARLVPYEQAGEPVVHVWFDLDQQPTSSTREVPACWSVEPQAVQRQYGTTQDWESYWEGLEDRQRLFQVEAGDYTRRLEAALKLDPRARVLDFGCGFGLVAEALAPKVGELFLWDASANMRCRARINVAHRCNIRFLDLSDPRTLVRDVRFDLILVNSVVQYMAADEFSLWLMRWRGMLASGGRLIISDLIPGDYPPFSDLVTLLVFSVHRRFLIRAIWQGLAELGQYLRMRSARPLRRVDRDDLRNHAAAAGFTVEFLPENLTFRTKRLTAILSLADF